MLQYRDIFYKQYFSSQLGRAETNYQKNLDKETVQLSKERTSSYQYYRPGQTGADVKNSSHSCWLKNPGA